MNSLRIFFINMIALLGRAGLSAIFVLNGWEMAMNWTNTVIAFQGKELPFTPLIVVAAIAIQILGATAFFLGYKSKIMGLLLFVYTLAYTAFFDNFWDGVFSDNLRDAFFHNCAIMGGLLFAILYGPGSWSFDRE